MLQFYPFFISCSIFHSKEAVEAARSSTIIAGREGVYHRHTSMCTIGAECMQGPVSLELSVQNVLLNINVCIGDLEHGCIMSRDTQ